MTRKGKFNKIKEPTEILDDKEMMFILKLHGQGMHIAKIKTAYKEKFNLEIGNDLLKDICSNTDNQVYVERYREEYLSKVKSVPIANKRIRLDDFQFMRDNLFNVLETLDVSDTEQRKELIAIYGKIREILADARTEMEGKPWLIQQINITELNHLSDAELQKRKEILIAKANGTYKERDLGIGEDSQGAEESIDEQPTPVHLAPPSLVQRIEL